VQICARRRKKVRIFDVSGDVDSQTRDSPASPFCGRYRRTGRQVVVNLSAVR
jgi:hypothetical protein